MKKIYTLENSIQEYEWGSPTALPLLLDYANPEGKPQAELWMGINAKGESLVQDGKEQVPLSKFIKSQKEWALGDKAATKFGNLPFLFKVLGIERPLSIQVHPTKAQAEEGFLKENKAGIPQDAPNRNYKDSNHKPEIIVAVSEQFWAMKGFRPIEAIIEEFSEAGFSLLNKELANFTANPTNEGLKTFWQAIMNIDGKRAESLALEALHYAQSKEGNHYHWVEQLFDYYPTDMGVLAPLYLNVVCLKEGEGLYLEAGELHAYLQGLGMELMANSDNVLRGGLTPKHIDIPELLANVNFESSTVNLLHAEDYVGLYPTPSPEFALSRIELTEDRLLNGRNPAQIVFCTKGKIRFEAVKGNEDPHRDSRYEKERFSLVLKRGESVFIPFNAGGYTLNGKGELFVASIPN